ncbi:hypothetical protein [Stackebrandtia nassauensis]|uniref:Uncharacterized protein n=1 Tax=Stackebrandtia nassauensis (strain DSM 44728 / CIP 108903 / NRRL B-16338 / NBRC 102104 / LLR-40K-21) TaxID=446470 RepID=D3Q4G6_STANL|nr:hypothetical protein [Stackebrandtia nassauensis]ADD40126.1 conserved hypothetical protein [Stackebrandtia nassauensis DSM 44728]
MNPRDCATVDWRLPATGLDAIFGDGATRWEKTLPTVTGLAGIAVLAAYAALTGNLDWSWWQYALAAILVFDLVGGVVTNALNSAKRFQHAERVAVPRRAASLVRNHVLFAAIHVQPIVIAALFPGVGLWWGVLWYAVTLAGVIVIPLVPLHLRRPAAMTAVALVPVVASVMPHPDGFGWLPAILVAKLVLGAVREEPYRPVAGMESGGSREGEPPATN